MTRIRIELNKAGIGQFLKDQKSNPKMLALLESEGQKIADRAGPGFKVERMELRKNRPGVIITAETREAMRAQAKDNRLGRALGGG